MTAQDKEEVLNSVIITDQWDRDITIERVNDVGMGRYKLTIGYYNPCYLNDNEFTRLAKAMAAIYEPPQDSPVMHKGRGSGGGDELFGAIVGGVVGASL